jgi:hypothetical protein
MASTADFEDSGLPLQDESGSQEGFEEFGEIQKALAEESGQSEESTEYVDPEPESLIDNEIDSANLEADALGAPEDAPEEPKKKARGTRADKRIQSLVKEKKEQQAQFQQELQKRDQYYRQYLGALQQQVAEQKSGASATMQEQLNLQRQQLELMQARRETEAKGNLTPMEEYELNLIKQASDKAGSQFLPEVTALREELDGLKAQREQEAEQAQRQQRYQHYDRETKVAREKVLLSGFAPDRAQQLAEPMDEMLLAFCGAFGVEPNVAAPQFKKYLDLYVQGSLENRARGGGQKIRKGRAIPKSTPGGKRSAKGSGKWPTPAKLRKAGFDNALDWVAAGEPIIG